MAHFRRDGRLPIKRSLLILLAVIFLLIPGTLYLGTRLPGRMYYLTGTLMILEMMLPFFLAFENRKPQARELVTVAVMCALAIAARVVIQIPGFKPMVAIIMLTGIAFGPEAGFMTGAVSAFASNFFFGQGPWTPWQMMAYGIGGFLAGLLFSRRRPFANRPWLSSAVLAVSGFLTVMLVVGPLLDTCTLFTMSTGVTWKRAVAVYAAGFGFNLSLGIATGATLLVASKAMLEKLDRLKKKYGILETDL